MLRYAITDTASAAGDPAARRRALLIAVRRWAGEGVDTLQLREKSLAGGELFSLAQALAEELRRLGSPMRLLVNSRADIALAAGARGVHLTAGRGELTPEQVRSVFAAKGAATPVVSVSCHNAGEAAQAASLGADLILFAPVFEKVVQGRLEAPGSGLERLREAVLAAGQTPVLALGGVTAANTAACLSAGALGVAGIRLFGEIAPDAEHRLTTK